MDDSHPHLAAPSLITIHNNDSMEPTSLHLTPTDAPTTTPGSVPAAVDNLEPTVLNSPVVPSTHANPVPDNLKPINLLSSDDPAPTPSPAKAKVDLSWRDRVLQLKSGLLFHFFLSRLL